MNGTPRVDEEVLVDIKNLVALPKQWHSEADEQTHARMLEYHRSTGHYPLFAEVMPLTSDRQRQVTWNTKRAWFDDVMRVFEWKDRDRGRQWTPEDDVDDSYCDWDIEAWDDPQGERSSLLTLPSKLEDHLDSTIEQLEIEQAKVHGQSDFSTEDGITNMLIGSDDMECQAELDESAIEFAMVPNL